MKLQPFFQTVYENFQFYMATTWWTPLNFKKATSTIRVKRFQARLARRKRKRIITTLYNLPCPESQQINIIFFLWTECTNDDKTKVIPQACEAGWYVWKISSVGLGEEYSRTVTLLGIHHNLGRLRPPFHCKHITSHHITYSLIQSASYFVVSDEEIDKGCWCEGRFTPRPRAVTMKI